MKSLLPFTLAASLLASPMVNAMEIAGIKLADQVQVQQSELQLNGAGVRSKFFMDLYVGSLYLSAPAHDLASVLTQPNVMINLDITSGLISSDKMKDAITEGFDLATANNTAPLQARINEFMGLFSEAITPGDQFSFLVQPGVGVSCSKNGTLLATIKGDDFSHALLAIWLGQAPAQKSLKQAMLGE
ncbi:chalcone isomerase [Shewanella sp. SNU WT4]|uniref:chalcone isomerase family protein n=1 Tax=Shewanella sp. SNU WT4 TaxID=2590015 RepID=UPI001129C909|nr:chalcone isomerase family protein [Shewanella sp. SNU WT4]QDF66520.1 chalcone isomerase [Shewanella sp. SNU WT4]